MAWVRTAVSLISFGFTIYKFFEFEAGKNLPEAKGAWLTPRQFGMIMITTGLVALALATYDFRRNTKWMAMPKGHDGRFVSSSVAVIVSGMGLLALAAAFARG
jgi:putative membrane protein